jgi:hypothetical protein
MRRILLALKEILWKAADEKERDDRETNDYLIVAKQMKIEREKIESAKAILKEMEKNEEVNMEAILALKKEIEQKGAYLSRDIFSKINGKRVPF